MTKNCGRNATPHGSEHKILGNTNDGKDSAIEYAALVMQLGAEAIFVGSGIFKSDDPEARARAMVKAATYFNDPGKLLEASEELGIGMAGIDISKLAGIGTNANSGLVDEEGRSARFTGRFRCA